MQMYSNSYYRIAILYSALGVEIKAELGEYAYLHLSMSSNYKWRISKKVFSIVISELNKRGYKYAFALMPKDNKLTKHFINEFGFEYLGDKGDYHLIRVSTAKLPIRLKRQSIQLS